jgi:hypothetical protein
VPLVVGQEQRAAWEQIGKDYYGPEFEITEVCCASCDAYVRCLSMRLLFYIVKTTPRNPSSDTIRHGDWAGGD